MSRPLDPRLLAEIPLIKRLVVVLALVQSVGTALFIAQAGLLSRVIVQIFQQSQPLHVIVSTLLWLAVIGIVRAGLPAGIDLLTSWASTRARAELRQRVLDTALRNGPIWAASQPRGRLATAAGPGLEALDGYLGRVVPALVGAVVGPPMVLLCIGVADWQSALILLVTLPLVPVFMILVGKSTRRNMQRQYAALSRLSGHFLDLLQGLPTLKVYGKARHQIDAVRRVTESYRVHTMNTLRLAFLSGLVLDLLATLSVAVVAVDIGLRLDAGGLPLSTALFVLLLAPELFAPIRALGAQHHANEEGQVATSAALDVLDEARQQPPLTGATGEGESSDSFAFNGRIHIDGLSVHYRGGENAALDDLNLILSPGEILALEGPSGGGKSSLLNVLLGFLPDAAVGGADAAVGGAGVQVGGTVHVGGNHGWRELSTISPQRWLANVAWVPQRPRPTAATVGEEVAMGAADASDSVVRAAIVACAAPSPQTLLGEDGAHVSAGERRRIALARALLRARHVHSRGAVPLVLLDEPSEDLDAATETVVRDVIAGMAGWATVIVISHSRHVAAVADRVLTVQGGRVRSSSVSHQVRNVAVSNPVLNAVSTAACLDEDEDVTARRTTAPEGIIAAGPRISSRETLRRLSPILRGLDGTVRWLSYAALFSAAAGIAGLALTASSIWLICRASQHPNVQALEVAVVGVRLFALARALLRYGERLASHNGALRVLARVRAGVFEALVPLLPAGIVDLRRGDLLRRFVGDVDGVQEVLVRALVPVFGAVVTCGAAVLLAATLVPAAGLVLFVGLLFAAVISGLCARTAVATTELASAVGRRDTQTTAILDGLAELRAYGCDTSAMQRLALAEHEVYRLGDSRVRWTALSDAVVGLAAALTFPITLGVIATAVSNGTAAPIYAGVLLACLLVGFEQAATLPTAFAAWLQGIAGLGRVVELLDTPAVLADPATAPAEPTGALGLRFSTVTITPGPGQQPIIRDGDLTVAAGSRVALVGPSGSGKSTVLAAALRQLPVQGTVVLTSPEGPTELSALRADQMPALIAGSLQNDHVFDVTLRDNVRLVRPEATDDDLIVVAKRAGLADFVCSLQDGWSTLAGPDGASLSGGQRQRLLLARALLAAPQILVLDEPTAHLDPETERLVLRDILDATRGQTILMSTHRRHDEIFDAVVEIQDGSCVLRS